MKDDFVAGSILLCVISVLMLINFYGNPFQIFEEMFKAGEYFSLFIQTFITSIISSSIMAAIFFVIYEENSDGIK